MRKCVEQMVLAVELEYAAILDKRPEFVSRLMDEAPGSYQALL